MLELTTLFSRWDIHACLRASPPDSKEPSGQSATQRRLVGLLLALAIALTPAVAPAADTDYRAYRHQVDRETAKTWREHRWIIDPMNQRGRAGGLDLDHIKPVKQCWVEKLPAKECGSLDNLRMLDARRNRSEGCRELCGRPAQQPN